MDKRTINMTTGSPAKHILHFAFPLILTNMGQQLYMIADGAIVGRGVGVKALAAAILRALGDGKTPLTAMIIAALLNIALDCLFVFVFEWGIVGAATASLIAQGVSFVYCVIVISKIEYICLDKESWKFGKDRIVKLLLFGIPIAFQYVVITFGGIILQSSVNQQGSFFIAGYTATNKLYSFLQCFAMSFGLATSTFIAQNYGANLFTRVKQGVAVSVKIVSITAVIVMAFTLLTRRYILRVFLDINEPGGEEALAIAVRYLTIMVLCFIILHILHIFRNVLLAMGISTWPMLSGFAELTARLFMAKIMLSQIGADALFLAEPASWFGAMLCTLLPYFYYRKKLLQEKTMEP